jgi:hypothetical protein
MECLNQGVLVVGPERHVKVERRIGGREPQALPVVGDGFPRVLHFQIVPTWGEKRRKTATGNNSEGEEHIVEAVVAHGYRR